MRSIMAVGFVLAAIGLVLLNGHRAYAFAMLALALVAFAIGLALGGKRDDRTLRQRADDVLNANRR